MSRIKRFLVRSAVVVGVATPVVGTLGVLWYRSAYTLPPEPTPTVHLPSPNGYDTLLAAHKLEVAKLGAAEISPRDPKLPQPLAERQKLLAANASAISKVREALGQEYLNPPATTSDMDFPRLALFRELSRMLAFASKAHADSGELAEASRCALDGIEIGVAAPRGGVLITGLVGVACEAIGQRALWRIADQLDAPSARAAARRLAGMDARRWTYTQTLRGERQYMLSTTRMLFSAGPGKATWDALGESVHPASQLGMEDETPPSPTQRAGAFWDQAKMIYYGPRAVQRNTDAWLTVLAARSTDPWGARRALPPFPDDPLSQTWLPVFAQADFKWVDMQTYSALLQTYLALRAWKLEYGAYPESLDALVRGGILKALPVDAFSPTRSPLPYRRESPDRMVLWSVGPDAKDNGGKAAEVRDSEGKLQRGHVFAETTGDIVARVNSW